MRNLILLVGLAFMLSNCGNKKNIVESKSTPSESSDLPAWLMQRPVLSTYYIGIARIRKSRYPQTFAEEAKKQALNDLGGEIKVKVEANSILYTFEKNGERREDFVESIKLKSAIEIEDYEQVDTYESSTEYAVYYRLDKQAYLKRKQEIQNKSVELAKQHLTKAEELAKQNDWKNSVQYKLKALEAIQQYWAEPLKTEWKGEEVFFGNTLFNSLQQSFDELLLVSNRSELQLGKGIPSSEKNSVQIKMSVGNKGIASFPFKGIGGGKLISVPNQLTNTTGLAIFKGMKVSKVGNYKVELIPDLKSAFMIKPTTLNAIRASLQIPSVWVSLNVHSPKVNVQVSGVKSAQGLTPYFMESFQNNGLQYEVSKPKADLVCKIEMSPREGGELNGLFTTYVSVNLKLLLPNGQQLYTKEFNNLKGVALNYKAAEVKALESFKKKFRYEILPEINKVLK